MNITAKDVLTSAVTILTSWPLILLLIVFLLREKIKLLLERILKVRWGDKEVEFDDKVEHLIARAEVSLPHEPVPAITGDGPESLETTRSQKVIEFKGKATFASPETQVIQGDEAAKIQSLAQTFPSAAIVVAYAELENQAKALGTALKIDPPTVNRVIDHLVAEEKLPDATKSIVKELRTLRNKAAHNPEAVSNDAAENYSALAADLKRDLRNILRDFPGEYTVVYKGGPNNGIIETGADAARTIQGLSWQQIKGEAALVWGKPEVGRGMKGLNHAILYAMFYQNLTPDKCGEIYQRAGFDVMKMFGGAHYHADQIIDELVVMKYYPPGADCPCPPGSPPKKDGNAEAEQKETSAE